MSTNKAAVAITMPLSLEIAVQNRASERGVSFDDIVNSALHRTHYCEETVFQIQETASLADVEAACDRYRASENLFYPLRLDGVFDTLHARAVHPAQRGGKLLDAAQSQLEFHYQNVEGTLVCLWSPRYSHSFSIPGYHFHVLSKDRTKGGHVLNCAASRLRVGVQTISEYDVRLPENGTFLKVDFSRDLAPVLAKTE